ANSWIRRTDAPPVDDSVEMVIAPAVLPGGCLICEGLRNLPESENPLAPTSGEFWSSIDAVADDEQSQVWMSLRRRGWPVKVVAAPGEAKGEPGMDRRTTYAVDLEDAFGDTGPKRARRNRKPDLRVHASHAPRDRIAVYLGFISRKFRKGGGMSEGGVVTIPDGYWPFFKQLLQAGAEQTGISLSLTEPPVPADEADLVYLQHHSMLWGRFRKVLNYTKALEVEGDHQEELLAFRDRVLSRYGRYADPEAYLTLRISEWHGGLHVGTPDDPQFGAITMFGKVPLLLAALERAIADCAREKGYDHGGDPSGEPGEEDPDVGIE
ncbi:MAG: hypothetical protein FJZ01_28320, partial [Candidatus Sericytochromatia bacterium]|nr:hypothetical protein [Candidatus Tanganyikabacteria bacterium]